MEQPVEKYYTYADCLALSDDVRAELINGELYMMASPDDDHQTVSFELSRQLGNFLIDKPCTGYAAPYDVHLFENDDEQDKMPNIVVQPDIFVVCDEKSAGKNISKALRISLRDNYPVRDLTRQICKIQPLQ